MTGKLLGSVFLSALIIGLADAAGVITPAASVLTNVVVVAFLIHHSIWSIHNEDIES